MDNPIKILLINSQQQLTIKVQSLLRDFMYPNQTINIVYADGLSTATPLIARDEAIAIIVVIISPSENIQLTLDHLLAVIKNNLTRIILVAENLEDNLIIEYDLEGYLTLEQLEVSLKIHLISAIKSYLKFTKITKKFLKISKKNGELKQIKKQFQGILDIENHAIIFINEQQEIQLFNQGASAIFGYTSSEILGQPLDILLPEIFRNNHSQHIKDFKESSIKSKQMAQRTRSIFAQRKNGQEFPVEAFISKIELTTGITFIVILRELTNQLALENQLKELNEQLEIRVEQRTIQLKEQIKTREKITQGLQESEKKFRELVEHIQDVFWITDIDKKEIIYVSPAYEKIWGKKCEELYEKPHSFLEAIHPQDRGRIIQALSKQILGNYNEEYRIIRPNGEICWIKDQAFVINTPEGKIERIVGIAEDITSQKEAAEQLEKFAQELENRVKKRTTELQLINQLLQQKITEKEQAEIALKSSETRYAIITELSPVGIFQADLQGNCLYVNQEWCNIAGSTIQSALGLGWLNTVYHEDRELLRHKWQLAMENHEGFTLEYRFQCPDNTTTWVFGQAVTEINEQGDLIGFIGTITDINERKKAEFILQKLNQDLEQIIQERTAELEQINQKLRLEIKQHKQTEMALRESEERWQLAIKGSKDAIWDWNLKTNKVFFSPRWQEIHGFTENEISNDLEVWHNRIHPDDFQIVMQTLNDHFAQKTPFFTVEYRVKRQDNSYIWVLDRGQALWDEEGNVIRMAGSETDISERKKAEEELKHQTEILQSVFDNIPVMICFYDNQGQLKWANHQLEKVLGWNFAEMQNMNLLEECYPDREYRQNVIDIMINVTRGWHDFKTKIKDGSVIDTSWANVRLSDGTSIGIGQDISDRKSTELALQKAKEIADAANQAKSEFLANISHEIRTPMNAILGFCDLLQGLINDERPRNYLESIFNSSKILLALINDILDLSKIESGKLKINHEPVNLSTLIAEIVQIFSQNISKKDIKLITELNQNLPKYILFDEVRLRQILFNVVGNAIKFTETGSIYIGINCQFLNPSNYIELKIEIEDTGIGIAEEQQAKIFDAFTQSEGQSTRKYGGTGLGLTITKRLTEMLGGNIQLISDIAKGSKFIFTFSSVEIFNELLEISENFDINFTQFLPATILVVDDIQSNLDLIEGYFADTEHKLLFARDGVEAIYQTELHHPDLILMDLRMPNLDGKDAIEYLKNNSQTQNIPIIIMSASFLQTDQELMQKYGVLFLHKPVSRANLVRELKNILPMYNNYQQNFTQDEESLNSNNSGNKVINLVELLEKLNYEKENSWQQLCQTMKIRDLRKFAENLTNLAQEYECYELGKYAAKLTSEIKKFDGENLPKTLALFPQIIENLSG
jgi:PAS domain S-box-containing protein